MLADGFIANPILLHAYFGTIGVLEGRTPQEILSLTKEQFHQAWGLALVLWTPVQFLNFYFVPVHFQAAFVSAVNVGWKAALSVTLTLTLTQTTGAGAAAPPLCLTGGAAAPHRGIAVDHAVDLAGAVTSPAHAQGRCQRSRG